MNNFERLSKAFSSDQNALEVLSKHGEIFHIEWEGKLYCTAGEILAYTGLDRSQVSSFNKYAPEAIIDKLGLTSVGYETSPQELIGLFTQRWKVTGKKNYLYSVSLSLYVILCLKCDVSEKLREEFCIIEYPGTSLLKETLNQAVLFEAPTPEPGEPAILTADPSNKLKRPDPPRPTRQFVSVYCDASVVIKKGYKEKGTTIAVYSPELRKGFIRCYPGMCLQIDQAEMLGAVLAAECFPEVSIIYTDSKNCVDNWTKWKDRCSELTALDASAPLRPILFKDIQVSWIPREKNAVADYLAKWGNEHKQGWYNVKPVRPPSNDDNWINLEKIYSAPSSGDQSLTKGFGSATPIKIIPQEIVEKIVEKVVEVKAEPTVSTALDVLNKQIEEVEDLAYDQLDEIVSIKKQVAELEQQEAVKRESIQELMRRFIVLTQTVNVLSGEKPEPLVSEKMLKESSEKWIEKNLVKLLEKSETESLDTAEKTETIKVA